MIQQTMGKIRNSVMTRLLVISGLVMALLIPVEMIKGVIHEREQRREEVIKEVSSKWGQEQSIAGPILTVPYTAYATDESGNRTSTLAYAHLLPESLTITGLVKPENRYRGIYQVVLYNTDLQVAADFKTEGIRELGIPERDIHWDKASISLGVPDLRGVKESNLFIWNNEKIAVNSGIAAPAVMDSGVSAPVPVSSRLGRYSFQMRLNLNGSGQINFIPLGKVTTVNLTSPWKNPSFSGLFLPDERTVNEQGFSATWKILNLNRNYPQQWCGKNEKALESAFGAKFFWPVDQYQKSMRSVKYAVLFIGLTLVVFFLTEVTNRTRVHPIQYLLIGFAICIFYLLLLSISEHTSFDLAYPVSAVASTLLVAGYSKGILKSVRISATIAALMSFLYGFLYVTLQMEDFALLIGSLGLFVALGAVMYLTRKINWYAIAPEEATDVATGNRT